MHSSFVLSPEQIGFGHQIYLQGMYAEIARLGRAGAVTPWKVKHAFVDDEKKDEKVEAAPTTDGLTKRERERIEQSKSGKRAPLARIQGAVMGLGMATGSLPTAKIILSPRPKFYHGTTLNSAHKIMNTDAATEGGPKRGILTRFAGSAGRLNEQMLPEAVMRASSAIGLELTEDEMAEFVNDATHRMARSQRGGIGSAALRLAEDELYAQAESYRNLRKDGEIGRYRTSPDRPPVYDYIRDLERSIDDIDPQLLTVRDGDAVDKVNRYSTKIELENNYNAGRLQNAEDLTIGREMRRVMLGEEMDNALSRVTREMRSHPSYKKLREEIAKNGGLQSDVSFSVNLFKDIPYDSDSGHMEEFREEFRKRFNAVLRGNPKLEERFNDVAKMLLESRDATTLPGDEPVFKSEFRTAFVKDAVNRSILGEDIENIIDSGNPYRAPPAAFLRKRSDFSVFAPDRSLFTNNGLDVITRLAADDIRTSSRAASIYNAPATIKEMARDLFVKKGASQEKIDKGLKELDKVLKISGKRIYGGFHPSTVAAWGDTGSEAALFIKGAIKSILQRDENQKVLKDSDAFAKTFLPVASDADVHPFGLIFQDLSSIRDIANIERKLGDDWPRSIEQQITSNIYKLFTGAKKPTGKEVYDVVYGKNIYTTEGRGKIMKSLRETFRRSAEALTGFSGKMGGQKGWKELADTAKTGSDLLNAMIGDGGQTDELIKVLFKEQMRVPEQALAYDDDHAKAVGEKISNIIESIRSRKLDPDVEMESIRRALRIEFPHLKQLSTSAANALVGSYVPLVQVIQGKAFSNMVIGGALDVVTMGVSGEIKQFQNIYKYKPKSVKTVTREEAGKILEALEKGKAKRSVVFSANLKPGDVDWMTDFPLLSTAMAANPGIKGAVSKILPNFDPGRDLSVPSDIPVEHIDGLDIIDPVTGTFDRLKISDATRPKFEAGSYLKGVGRGLPQLGLGLFGLDLLQSSVRNKHSYTRQAIQGLFSGQQKDGKELRPSDKDPKVRRWQRIRSWLGIDKKKTAASKTSTVLGEMLSAAKWSVPAVAAGTIAGIATEKAMNHYSPAEKLNIIPEPARTAAATARLAIPSTVGAYPVLILSAAAASPKFAKAVSQKGLLRGMISVGSRESAKAFLGGLMGSAAFSQALTMTDGTRRGLPPSAQTIMNLPLEMKQAEELVKKHPAIASAIPALATAGLPIGVAYAGRKYYPGHYASFLKSFDENMATTEINKLKRIIRTDDWAKKHKIRRTAQDRQEMHNSLSALQRMPNTLKQWGEEGESESFQKEMKEMAPDLDRFFFGKTKKAATRVSGLSSGTVLQEPARGPNVRQAPSGSKKDQTKAIDIPGRGLVCSSCEGVIAPSGTVCLNCRRAVSETIRTSDREDRIQQQAYQGDYDDDRDLGSDASAPITESTVEKTATALLEFRRSNRITRITNAKQRRALAEFWAKP